MIHKKNETEDSQIPFLTEVKRILDLEKDEIISCARLLENVLILTMPEFILSKISNNTSTPRKSSSKLNFKGEYSENKENDDSAINMNSSLMDSLCLSSPTSSSSSRQSSTKSSPDSGASVSSYRARL